MLDLQNCGDFLHILSYFTFQKLIFWNWGKLERHTKLKPMWLIFGFQSIHCHFQILLRGLLLLVKKFGGVMVEFAIFCVFFLRPNVWKSFEGVHKLPHPLLPIPLWVHLCFLNLLFYFTSISFSTIFNNFLLSSVMRYVIKYFKKNLRTEKERMVLLRLSIFGSKK